MGRRFAQVSPDDDCLMTSFLCSICEGEERKLIIPPSYAYGDVGAGDVIPPGATLLMDVKCDKIERKSS